MNKLKAFASANSISKTSV